MGSMSNGVTILCAEDEPELREDIVGELKDAGYEVIEAINGEDALMAIDTFTPDIVLCDINMPRMTGLEVLERVRASETEISDVPFIFLTAYGEKSDLIKGRQLGAAVMERLHQEAEREGKCRVTLSSFTENHGAIRFYERLGYNVVEEDQAFVSMSRPLGCDLGLKKVVNGEL